MKALGSRPRPGALHCLGARPGFTLIEMLVVVSIISLLVALLVPALNAARRSARRSTCQSNLRQIGVGLQEHASRHGSFCSGAFDWRHDGCVTEVGWVADLVDSGIPVGQLLCPSNPRRISETYNDLLTLTAPDPDACITLEQIKGSTPRSLPDGSAEYNPCRYILDNPDGLDMAPGSEARRLAIQQRVFEKHYNTNYTASWVLVRCEPALTRHGNLKSCTANPGTLDCRASAFGPLTLKKVDSAPQCGSFIPLLACGGVGAPLAANMEEEVEGSFTVPSFTKGPILTQDVGGAGGTALFAPGPFAETDPSADPPTSGTPRDGPLGTGWWAAWNATLQDYRRFAPVHARSLNVLFADGSVRNFADENKDGLLNNGFTTAAAPASGFSDDVIELPKEGVFSGWTLSPQ